MDKSNQTPAATDADVDAFLDKVRRATPAQPKQPGKRGRLIFAMDATASRQPTWDQACHIQADMFQETAAIGGLEVQLVYYRGFGECKASKWQVDGRGLGRLMTGVHCLGGRTQIKRVLSHALLETEREKVHAVVFVGDAFEENIDTVCHQAGELGLKGVPVFLFQEGANPVARQAFQQVAKLTNGAWCSFDLASPRQLRDLLSAVAVYATGGHQAMLDYADKQGKDVLQLTNQMGRKT